MKPLLLTLALSAAGYAQQVYPCQSSSPYPQPSPVANDTSTGTSLFKLADLTSSGGAIISNHSNSAGAVGVVVAGAGKAGSACVAAQGPVPLYVDGSTTAGHCVIRSTTTDGEGHDSGAACSTNPNGEFVGIVIIASTGADSLSTVMLKGAFMTSGSGATTNQNIRSVPFFFDGAGSAVSAATRCGVVRFAGAITGFTMISDVSGNATVDVKTVAFGSYTGPASASSITDGHTPSMTGATSFQDTTLTSWTTSISANTVVCFVLSSPATITWLSGNITIAAN